MKKVLILILCISMIVGLTACNNSNGEKNNEDISKETKVSQETEETKETKETEETEEETKESEETIEESTTETEAEKETKETEETEKATEKETEKSKDHQSKPAPKETEAAKPTYKRVDDVKYAKSNVNVRSGPGASYKKLGSLKAGQKVTRTGVCDNGWGVIDFNGKEGYVSGNYLVDAKPAAQTAEKPKDSKPAETKGTETKPKDTNTDDKPSGERVPKKSPDYKPVPKGWIYSEGLFGPAATSAQKKQIGSWVESWRKGGFTDKQLKDKLYDYMWETKKPDEEIDFIHVGVSGSDESPFISEKTPGKKEHSANINEVIYSYRGLYCTGELDTDSDGDFTLFHNWTISIDKFLKE